MPPTLYAMADEVLALAGYDWYEISNWARPGTREPAQPRRTGVASRGRPWAPARTHSTACGRVAGTLRALTLPRGARRRPTPAGGHETVAPDVAAAEAAMVGLRTVAGLSGRSAALHQFAPAVRWGIDNALLESAADGSVRLTLRGRMLSNELFVRLLPRRDSAALTLG